MSRLIKPILVTFVLISLACDLVTQSVQATQVSVPSQAALTTATSQLADTATVEASATALPTQAPTNTPMPVAATETVDPTFAALEAAMGSMGILMENPIPQFIHPVGEPLKSWHNVPIMPQATAGQEFSANIYSYIATATLTQAGQFYESKAASLGLSIPPITGSGVIENRAKHDVTFNNFNLTIVINSFDDDTSHVIVVISKVP
jgi:hypothetical protein